MGLELVHFKAVMDKPANKGLKLSYQTEERFYGFNVPFGHFHRYIQLIDVPVLKDTVIIVNREEDLEYAIKRLINSSHEILVRKNDEQLADDIKTYERNNGLATYTKSYNNETVAWTIMEYYKEEKKTGFYTEEISSQTSMVYDNFWEHFSEPDLTHFALKEDFDLVAGCIKPFVDDEGIERWQSNFKEQFVGKFEEGASFMWLGV